jgi:hypothetical protein
VPSLVPPCQDLRACVGLCGECGGGVARKRGRKRGGVRGRRCPVIRSRLPTGGVEPRLSPV